MYIQCAMKCRLAYIFLFSLAVAGNVWAQSPALSRFEARAQGSDIDVFWESANESNLKEYVLERKTRFDVDYKPVRTFSPHGPNRLYQFRDSNVYKDSSSEQVRYRLRMIREDGSFELASSISVNYFPTAIRRTWGSIKAMFQ